MEADDLQGMDWVGGFCDDARFELNGVYIELRSENVLWSHLARGLAQHIIMIRVERSRGEEDVGGKEAAHRPLTISTTPRHPCNSSSLRSMKLAKGNQDSSVLRRERDLGFDEAACM